MMHNIHNHIQKKKLYSYKACSDNQLSIISFAFDIFNFLTPEAIDILMNLKSRA
jgi:hypothetical protein